MVDFSVLLDVDPIKNVILKYPEIEWVVSVADTVGHNGI